MNTRRFLLLGVIFMTALSCRVFGDDLPPSISGLSNQTILEDASITVDFTVSDADSAIGSVTVTASSSNSSLVQSLTPGGSTASRTLTIRPVTDANGTATITVTATDNTLASSSTTFVLTVSAVNDAPTFSLSTSTVTATEDVAKTLASFATSISKGASNESSQTVTFVVTPTSSGFYSSQPAISSSGTLTFQAASNVNGTDVVTVKLTDNGGTASGGDDESATVTFTVQVDPVNDAPTISGLGSTVTMLEDGTVTTSFTVGDIEQDVASITVTATSSNTALVTTSGLVVTASGTSRTLTITPVTDANGTATITVTASDGQSANATSTATFSLTVTAVNDAPTFTIPTATANGSEDVAGSVSSFLTSISKGASNESSQTLTFTVTPTSAGFYSTQPAISSSGTLTFQGAANVNGSDVVTVRITDNGDTSNGGSNQSTTGTFTIVLAAVNDAPTITGLGSTLSMLEDATAATEFTVADLEQDVASITVTATSSNQSLVANSGLTVTASGASRALVITPITNANGTATITVTANDGSGSGTATSSSTFSLTVTAVNDAPTYTIPTATANGSEDVSGSVSGFLTSISNGASNESSQSLTFTVTPTSSGFYSTQPAISATGVLTFRGATNVYGSDVVTVRITDNGDTSNGGSNQSVTGTFTIVLAAVNDAPTISTLSAVSMLEDATASNSFTVADVEQDVASVTVTATSSNQSLVANSGLVVTASGASRTLAITPVTHANGTATITVTANDGTGSATATSSSTFSLTVTAVNDAPTFTLPTPTANGSEDVSASISNFLTSISKGASNETSQNLTVTVTPTSSAFYQTQPAISTTGTLTFRGATNVFGSDSVTVRISDDGGTSNSGANISITETFTIVIAAVNDSPTISGLTNAVTMLEDATASTSFTVSDVEEAVASITVTATSSNASLVASSGLVVTASGASRTLAITPITNGNGTATIRVIADDGTGGTLAKSTNSFTLTVTAVNDKPTFTLSTATSTANEDTSVTVANFITNISKGATNESSQTLTFNVVPTSTAFYLSVPQINSSGTLTYRGATNVYGSDIVTVRLDDNGDTTNGGANQSTTTTFTIVLNNVNDRPVISGLTTTVSMLEDASATTSFTVSDVEQNVASVTVTATSSNSSLVASTGLAVTASGASRTLTIRPVTDANGTATIRVIADDGTGGTLAKSTNSFTLTVTAVNDVPSFSLSQSTVTVNEDIATTVNNFATSISKGPSNENSQTVSFTVTPTSSAKYLVQPAITSAGKLTFRGATNVYGSDVVSVRLSDNGGTANNGIDTSATQTFTIVLNAVNDRPTITGLTNVTMLEDATAATSFTVGDIEENVASISVSAESSNQSLITSARLVVTASGASRTLTISPLTNANGTATIRVIANDTSGAGTAKTTNSFTLTVTAVNDRPSFTLSTATVNANEDVAARVTAFATSISKGATNENSQILTFTVTPTSSAMYLVQPAVSATGILTFRGATNVYGSDVVTIKVGDNGGTDNGGLNESATQAFTIVLANVNDRPTISSLTTSVSMLEDGTASTSFTVSDIEQNAASITVTATSSNQSLITNDRLVVTASGGSRSLAITPITNANGTATIRVIADDGTGGTLAKSTNSFSLTVTAVNDVPSFSLSQSTVTANEDAAVRVAAFATSINKGAVNENSQTLTFTVTPSSSAFYLAQPAISATGILTFRGATNVYGSDVVTVKLSDSGGTTNNGDDESATQTFTIVLNNVNDRPVVSGLTTSVTMLEDATASTSFTVSDIEQNAASITVTATSSNQLLVSNSRLVVTASGASRTLAITPLTNANGTATIRVIADDGTGGTLAKSTNSFSLTVTAVNDVPSFTLSTATVTANEDAATTVASFATSISKGAANENSQTLTFTVTPTSTAMYLVAPAISATGTLTFRGATNVYGSDVVTVKLNDNGGTTNNGDDESATQAFTIVLNNVNDRPVISGLTTSETILEDATTSTSFLVSDIEQAAGSITVTATSSNQLLVSNAGLTVAASGASRTLTVRPVTNANGSATIRVIADDGTGGNLAKSTNSFSLTITAVNDVPSFTLSQSTVTVNEDAATTITTFARNISKGAANESSQTLSFTVTPTSSTMYLVAPAISASGTLTFRGATNVYGTDVVSVRLSDSGGTDNGGVDTSATQTFTIVLNAVNDRPTISGLTNAVTVLEDFTATTSFTVGDVEENVGSISVSATSSNQALVQNAGLVVTSSGSSRSLTITPVTNANGTATIRVIADDTSGAGVAKTTNSFTLTITAVNDIPTFTLNATTVTANEDAATTVATFARSISKGATNESSQTLTFTVTPTSTAFYLTAPAISSSGTLTFRGATNVYGSDVVTVRASDSGGTDNGGVDTSVTATFTIVLNNVNDRPTISTISSQTMLEDATQGVTFTVSDVEQSASAITVSATSANQSLVANSGLSVAASGSSRTLTITPVSNANGTTTIRVIADDGTGTTTAKSTNSFSLTVTAVNDVPSFTLASATVTAPKDASSLLSVSNFARNISKGAANESSQTLTFTVTSTATFFETAPAISSSGVLTFKPAAGITTSASGTTVTVKLTDSGGTDNGGVNESATQAFKIVISASATGVTLSSVDDSDSSGQAVSVQAHVIDGWVYLTINGQAGRTYLIQTSEDLATWTDLETVESTGEQAEVVHSGAADGEGRFYRVIDQTPPSNDNPVKF